MATKKASKAHTIIVGDILEENYSDEYSSYVRVDVRIDKRPVEVYTNIGVEPYQVGTFRASSRTILPMITAWQEEREDLQDVEESLRPEVREALRMAAPRLWRERRG